MAMLKPDPARLALARFGLGVRATMTDADLAAVGRDPVGALLAELKAPPPADPPGLVSAREAVTTMRAFDMRADLERMAREAERRGAPQGPFPEPAMTPPAPPPDKVPRNPIEDINRAEFALRWTRAMTADLGFRERLVWFWSNHFCVSMDKSGLVRAMAAGYEREAIRAHVTGPFAAMAAAAIGHPAMLIYLDNHVSVGPGSPDGRRRNKGLNENLAREALELHTLGVRSVYGQADVTSLARALTGWSFAGMGDRQVPPFSFRFQAHMHEPGEKTLLGRNYPQGEMGARQALDDLARHPATARHLAVKLVRHFVADDPPPAVVRQVEKAFIASSGHLGATAEALVTSKDAWDAPLSKLRNPMEWIVATHRGLGLAIDQNRINRALTILGQPLWRPPSPKGYSDMAGDWMVGLVNRMDVAHFLIRGFAPPKPPLAVAEQMLGPQATRETREAIRRAETPHQALVIASLSPEFLRR